MTESVFLQQLYCLGGKLKYAVIVHDLFSLSGYADYCIVDAGTIAYGPFDAKPAINPHQAWMVPRDRADEAREIVDSAPRVQRARTGGGETKRCWECGREFTRGDAYRNEGDWNDGYCGC